MSVDTRTPRTLTGARSSGFDDAPALSMVKVPSDPAQVIVNHASFRVQLNATPTRSARVARAAGAADTGRVPVAGARRRAPVVWSGRSAPGDTGATGLLQAVRETGVRRAVGAEPGDGGATQVIPRVTPRTAFDDTVETPGAGGPETRLLPAQMRSTGSAYEETAGMPVVGADDRRPPDDYDGYAGYDGYGPHDDGYGGYDDGYELDADGTGEPRHGDARRPHHAYYPGRRLNLGVVLLPLRVFLGLISVYAGLGKLSDPVYFDGGERGSMMKWLNSLHPWALAEPLRDFALQHPVGAGLTIAFLQVIVGVLTVLGLWQRVAAVVGALLSAALIVTVSWRTVPAYDAPDIIYLAAWSPLIIAGAPVYSADGRLGSEAWRTLGPRAELWALRRRVLRRGTVVASVAVGLTLLLGSVLGGAVRDADRVTVPGPGQAPRNELPGSPLPQEPGKRRAERSGTPSASGTPTRPPREASPEPSRAAATPGAATGGTPPSSGTTSAGTPSQTQGTVQQPPARQPAPTRAPATSAGPTSGGSASAGATGGATGGGESSGSTTGGSTGTGGNGTTGGAERRPGLVGGLIGGD
ncbi:DoxX family membrane protein [Streptomyces sp. NPDC005955]|uniref:DoxX family protein n=1 Tax=Streptomyces sp. NPDC005955 TaxID=3364738 RepID=UPI0036AE19AA